MTTSVLAEHIDQLLRGLDDIDLTPPSRDVRLVEINDTTPHKDETNTSQWVGPKPPPPRTGRDATDYARAYIRKDDLLKPAEYENRFNELLSTHPFRKSAEWMGHPPVDLDVVRD